MAIHFNENTVTPIISADGVTHQPLLNKARVPDILFELDRLTIPPGGQKALAIAPQMFFLPSLAHWSASSAIVEDGVIG